MSKKLTPEQLDSVKGLSSREAARILGVGKSTVNDARARADRLPGYVKPESPSSNRTAKIETRSDGSLIVETTDSVPQTKDHVDERMRKRGFDPEEYEFTYRFSEWDAQSKDGVITMYSARAGATRKPAVKNAAALDTAELIETLS